MPVRVNPVTPWNQSAIKPVCPNSSFIDESAVLIGDIRLGEEVYIGPVVSLRADEGSPIEIGSRTNIQDRVVMHALMKTSISIGNEVSIAHGAVVHGPCRIGNGTFVGFNAVIHNSLVGEQCFIGHGSLVIGVNLPVNVQVPNGAIIDDQDKANALPPATRSQHEFNREVVAVNRELAKGYRS